MKSIPTVILAMLCFVAIALCQTETATISGRITDPSGAAISGADVQVQNVLTGREVRTKTNSSGLYVATALEPGTYRIIVSNSGFKQIVKPDVVLNVQDNTSFNFSMTIGSASETVTVAGGSPLVNTQDASISTVTNREFVANLPLNGRTLQNLIELTPGVSLATTSAAGATDGTFSVNGMRAASNAFSIDGVSANAGVSTSNVGGQEAGGAIPAFSALGTSSNMVSIDALQEFRVQTSTYAPEFGRQPGGQISFSSRSGTNSFHGDLFDYVRNNYFDARDWFNQTQLGQPQAEERQNDFGGVFGGPLIKDRSFFFFSYEGLRLRQPTSEIQIVPSMAARDTAPAALQPYLNAYPVPNGTVFDSSGTALWNASFSNASNLDSYSLRIDHKIKDNLTVFARYARSPSEVEIPSYQTTTTSVRTQTLTSGAAWTITNKLVNEVRFNYTRNSGSYSNGLVAYSGAVPFPASVAFPSGFTFSDARFLLSPGSGVAYLSGGPTANNLQRQYNIVDGVSYQIGTHLMKYGVDYRHLSPFFGPAGYVDDAFFPDFPSFLGGNPFIINTQSSRGGTTLFNNLGFYVQDAWKITPHLTVTYGLRDDIDFSPSSGGPAPPLAAVTGINDLNTVAPAPEGTPVWNTRYANFAPRVGVSYELHSSNQWEAVLSGGFGMFRDLVSQEVGGAISDLSFPFGNTNVFFCLGTAGSPACPTGLLTFPLTPVEAAPPGIPAKLTLPVSGGVFFDPNIKLPYSYQWNVGVQQSLGAKQSLSLRYVGSGGRQLLMQENVGTFLSNPNFESGEFLVNGGYSNYNSLQVQFVRRLSAGLQARANYTWAHSIDNASVASILYGDSFYFPDMPNLNRGDSDFDVRHTFSAAFSGDIPRPAGNALVRQLFAGWGADNIILARSATPIDVLVNANAVGFGEPLTGLAEAVRPDVVPGVPIFLAGSEYPGGKELNSAAFALPPYTLVYGEPFASREGTLGRNSLRGFSAFEWDFSLRRDFTLPKLEGAKLQLRCDVFNILNHPNFMMSPSNLSWAPAGSSFVNPQFGQVTNTLANSLNQGSSGGLTSLYQFGAARSMQLALKLVF
jgi:Carboxypeptidase regulatory-like domain/TonB dependent receptor